jgi:hypothetical protein
LPEESRSLFEYNAGPSVLVVEILFDGDSPEELLNVLIRPVMSRPIACSDRIYTVFALRSCTLNDASFEME